MLLALLLTFLRIHRIHLCPRSSPGLSGRVSRWPGQADRPRSSARRSSMRMIMRVKPGGTERAGAAAGASNRGQKLHEHALRPFAFRVQRTQRSSIPITYRDPEPLTSTRFCKRFADGTFGAQKRAPTILHYIKRALLHRFAAPVFLYVRTAPPRAPRTAGTDEARCKIFEILFFAVSCGCARDRTHHSKIQKSPAARALTVTRIRFDQCYQYVSPRRPCHQLHLASECCGLKRSLLLSDSPT